MITPCLSTAAVERIVAVRQRLEWYRTNPDVALGYPGALTAFRAMGAVSRTVLDAIQRARGTDPVAVAAVRARIDELVDRARGTLPGVGADGGVSVIHQKRMARADGTTLRLGWQAYGDDSARHDA